MSVGGASPTNLARRVRSPGLAGASGSGRASPPSSSDSLLLSSVSGRTSELPEFCSRLRDEGESPLAELDQKSFS